MLRPVYNSFTSFSEDLHRQVLITKDKALPVISTEFVRLNTQFVPFVKGGMKNAIVQQTLYTKGVIQGSNDYFVKRYWNNKTGKNNFYQVTADRYGDALAQKWAQILDQI